MRLFVHIRVSYQFDQAINFRGKLECVTSNKTAALNRIVSEL